MSKKRPKRLKGGRPAFDDRGNAIWEWTEEDDPTAIATERLRALAEGLSLETPAQPERPDPYNQTVVLEEEVKPRGRSLDDMRVLSEKIKQKREHEELLKRLREEPRTVDSAPSCGMRLLLQFEGRELLVDEQHPRITIGRGDENDLVVGDVRTSRLHAQIQIRGDTFVLVDLSANGTYVQTADGHVLFVRLKTVPFGGQGKIGFGGPPSPGSLHTISFTCEKD